MRIEVEGLGKAYRANQVLKGVSFALEAGKSWALLGPNGCGKSTLTRCLLGLTIPEKESAIRVDGQSYPKALPYLLANLGYMPQVPDFPPHLKVREILELRQQLTPKPALYKEQLLRGLEVDRYLHKSFQQLSHGMKQKVNIIQCFMFDFSVYFLDEPTAGLDPLNAYYLKGILKGKRDAGRTIFFTSHIMKEVEELADFVYVLLEGHIILAESLEQLQQERGAGREQVSLEEVILERWRRHTNAG